MHDIKPIDIIAAITIIGGYILYLFTDDGLVGNILIMVTAYYFGKKSSGIIIKQN